MSTLLWIHDWQTINFDYLYLSLKYRPMVHIKRADVIDLSYFTELLERRGSS